MYTTLATMIEAIALAAPSFDLPSFVESRTASVFSRYSMLNTLAQAMAHTMSAKIRKAEMSKKSSQPPAYPYSTGV